MILSIRHIILCISASIQSFLAVAQAPSPVSEKIANRETASISDSAVLAKPKADPGKTMLVSGIHAGIWAGTYIALNKAWYDGYSKSKFHFFDDWPEWNQMDKAGHMWTSYMASGLSGALWKYTGMNPRTATLLGGASAIAYQSIIEVQDGFSSEWGFSMYDMLFNLAGATTYVSQELGWKEQRFQIKFSYWGHDYPDEFIPRRDELFGKTAIERILKDYNSQTYWLSINPWSFNKTSNFWPRWLNLSLGYSSDLMLGGRENLWYAPDGTVQDHRSIPRIRRFYFAPDIDLTRIRTRSKFLHSVFFMLNFIKIPAPALEFNSQGRFEFHAIHF